MIWKKIRWYPFVNEEIVWVFQSRFFLPVVCSVMWRRILFAIFPNKTRCLGDQDLDLLTCVQCIFSLLCTHCRYCTKPQIHPTRYSSTHLHLLKCYSYGIIFLRCWSWTLLGTPAHTQRKQRDGFHMCLVSPQIFAFASTFVVFSEVLTWLLPTIESLGWVILCSIATLKPYDLFCQVFVILSQSFLFYCWSKYSNLPLFEIRWNCIQ